MSLFLPAIKIILAFLTCCVISFFIFKLVVALIFYRVLAGFFSSSRSIHSWQVAGFIIGVALPFVIFPTTVWLLRTEFDSLNLGWLSLILKLFFALFPLLFIGASFATGKIDEARRNWHPQNGEQRKYFDTGELAVVINWKNGEKHGEFINYCQNGKVRYYGHYESGLPVGEFVEEECDGSLRKVRVFDQKGRLVEEKIESNK